jgi:hypothetical protein
MNWAPMGGQKVETKDGFVVVDQYGDAWDVYADDGNGNLAVQRDAGERWEAATFDGDTITKSAEGATFGVTCQDEYIVRLVDNAGSLEWAENDA